MKVLITGIAGTGKTTISRALKERGIFCVDFTDTPGLCFWEDSNTKEKVEYSPVVSKDWFESHERKCDIEKLKEILSKHETIVVTGTANGSQAEYFPLFDKIILLQCDPQTIVHRMQTRDARFGKTTTEQEDNLEWQKEFDPLLLSQGAIPVNTEGQLEDVVDEIIRIVKQN